jgi:chemotaxis methyl-accepting protein methylase
VRRKVQIYATDIDPQAINQARAGVYLPQFNPI